MAHLKIRSEGRETLHQIEGDEVTIGRSDANDVDLADPVASKEHCRLELRDGRWKLVDLESKNGTIVEGSFRNKAWLESGTRIRIGHTELLFHAENVARRSPERAAVAATPRRRAAEAEETGEAEAPPPPKGNEKLAKLGLSILIGVVVLGVLIKVMTGGVGDTRNEYVLAQAEQLEREGRLNEAEEYLRQNADPSGKLFPRLEEKIREIQRTKEGYYKGKMNEAARDVFWQITKKIHNYDVGAEVDPQEILRLIEKLKTEYGASDLLVDLKRAYPQWYEGKVPARGGDRGREGGWVRVDFDKALARAREYEKEWRFREARETVEAFLASREAALDEEDLKLYRAEVQANVQRIELLADSVYRGQDQQAQRLVKNSRFDEAIATYQKIRDTFGIDAYVRKAQAAIDKIRSERPK